MTTNRWHSYKFRNGKTAKNRVVVPPMASGSANLVGFVTSQTLEHYENLSKSGAGIIFVEYCFIHQSGKSEPNQLGVNLDSQISGLQELSEVIQGAGALSALQIVHAGGKSDSQLTGLPLWGPSAICTPVYNRELEKPFEVSPAEIKQLIDWYTHAAQRALAAGFDILELHSAHGYGLNQWLSPLTNVRADCYGGNIRGRSRLLIEIIKSIKTNFPSLLLSVRLPAQDHADGGLEVHEMQWVVSQLEDLGVDLINVSSGIGGWRRPRGIEGQGYLIEDARQLKQFISIPVIGVGGIQDGDFIDQILADCKVDFAAVGRAILNDPKKWGEENLEKLLSYHVSECCA